jgi:hypothetical protein
MLIELGTVKMPGERKKNELLKIVRSISDMMHVA